MEPAMNYLIECLLADDQHHDEEQAREQLEAVMLKDKALKRSMGLVPPTPKPANHRQGMGKQYGMVDPSVVKPDSDSCSIM